MDKEDFKEMVREAAFYAYIVAFYGTIIIGIILWSLYLLK